MFENAAKTVRVFGGVGSCGLMLGVEVLADRTTREPLSPEKCGKIAVNLLDAGVIMTQCVPVFINGNRN